MVAAYSAQRLASAASKASIENLARHRKWRNNLLGENAGVWHRAWRKLMNGEGHQ